MSDQMAKEMFPDIKKLLYPDIVTTLIGTRRYSADRNGILMCMRNDSEKYYSDSEISELKKQLLNLANVDILDTTVKKKINALSPDLYDYVDEFIENFGRYRLVITDRYHGTIFSHVAGTPVIVLKSTDHKVTTGVDWFRGIYDSIVYVDEISDVPKVAEEMLQKNDGYYNAPYFEEAYYDKLKKIIDSI